MWTPAARAELARESLPDATGLSDAEWAVVAPLPPHPHGPSVALATAGGARRHPLRSAHRLRVAAPAAGLPAVGQRAPLASRLSQAGVFERLAHALTMADRERAGHEASPSGAILEAQATRSGGVGVKGKRGYDPARRVVGRKRHARTVTDSRLLVAAVSPADLHDSHGGVALLRASQALWPFLAHGFADRAYRGDRVGSATAITVEFVEPEEGQKGFAVQPRRWVIERTFGWIARCRRLARDHEITASSARAFFVLAAAMILVRRLARTL